MNSLMMRLIVYRKALAAAGVVPVTVIIQQKKSLEREEKMIPE